MTSQAERRTRDGAVPLSLEEVSLGDRVRVVGVRYYDTRARCAESGIQPGAELRCVDRHPGAIVVRTESGRSCSLHPSTASCISVERLKDRW